MDTISIADPAFPASLMAIKKSNDMMAAGCKELVGLVSGAIHSHYSQTMLACEAMSKAESVKDVWTIQGDYLREYTQTALSGTTQFAQCCQRLARETMASMTTR